MREYLNVIRNSISGERAYTDVLEVANYHRIQVSTGYRAAAEHIVEKLRADGVSCELLRYKSDEKTWYFGSRTFMEWDCRSAWCELVTPERRRIADFGASNMSIVQRSHGCDYSNTPLDIVMLDRGSDESSYEDVDMKGKLVFIRDAHAPYMSWAFTKKGAVGFITDFMKEVAGVRTRSDFIDVRNYISFWWKNVELEPKIFGFVLTPRQGDELAELIRKTKAAHEKDNSLPEYVQAVCKVDADLYPGTMDVVEARLPGETDEEILIVAHLCHPRASANDNASGVSCAMEIMRTLKRLLETGGIPALKRGIRMILVPEFAGTYAWLANHQDIIPKVMAGFNLDMVGGRQVKGYGPLSICGQPHANPAIVTDVAALCLDEVSKNVPSHNMGEMLPMFNGRIGRFSGGSDQFILDDPTINIPTPMLGQWPDVAYHTAADTVDCVDPFILHKSASIGACYAVLLANMEEKDVPQILMKTVERSTRDLGEIVSEALEGKACLNDTFARLEDFENFYMATCDDIRKYFSGAALENVSALIETYKASIALMFANARAMLPTACGDPGYEYKPFSGGPAEYDYVPLRLFRGPLTHVDDYAIGDPELEEAYRVYSLHGAARGISVHTLQSYVLYYMDGRRTLNEIAYLAMQEMRAGDIELIHEFVQLLIKFGIVKTV